MSETIAYFSMEIGLENSIPTYLVNCVVDRAFHVAGEIGKWLGMNR